MANQLTGDFDAVVQLSPLGMGSLLAALHRKGHAAEGLAGPHLPHSGSLNFPAQGDVASQLRGHLQFQVSTPSLRVPNDTDGSRITVAVELYAWFQNALGSAPAPEFVHGELNFTTGVGQTRCGDETLIDVDLRQAQVSFVPTPGSGANTADVERVREIATDVLRHTVEPVQIRVSGLGEGEFAVRQLAVRSLRGGGSAVALLLELSDGGPTPNPASVNQVFLGSRDDIAVALGREFVTVALRDKARDDLTGVAVSGSRFGLSFSASVDPATLSLALEQDRVRVRIEGSGSMSISGGFGFRITQRLGLAVRRGVPSFSLVGDPDIAITSGGFVTNGLFRLFKGRITSKIKTALLDALRDVGRELGDLVDDNITVLLQQLSLPVRFELDRIAISTEAVVLAGDVDIGRRRPVEAHFTNQIKRPAGPTLPVLGKFSVELDALASWIPGGTVQSYVWTEVRSDGTVQRRIDEPHRFVLQVLREQLVTTTSAFFAWPPYTWCLEVFGTQHVSGNSAPLGVSGKTCGVSAFVPSIDLPRNARLTVRVPDGEGGALADLNPWGAHRPHVFRRDEDCRGFLLVHHAKHGGASEAARVLRDVQEASAELLIFPTLVVTEEDEHCAAPDFAGLATTADAEGAWRERFGLERPGTTVLLGAAGRELWRDSGPLDAEVLGKVLKEHCDQGTRAPLPPRVRHVLPSVATGRFAPDLFFPCGPGEVAPVLALRKLKGRAVLICFWTAWSEASIEQLRRLREAHGRDSDTGPLVLLVNDGDARARAEKVLEQLELRFQSVFDEGREISARYGIVSWPTLVQVDTDGRIARIQQGLEPRALASEAVTGST